MKKRHALLALAIIGGCIEGGANNGGKQSGNQDGGVLLAIGEIAVDEHGRYFLSKSDGKLVVGDLETRSMDALENLPRPDVIAFWSHGRDPGFYLLSWSIHTTGGEPDVSETLISYDLDRRAVAWSKTLPRLDGRLDVSPDGSRILLSDADDMVAFDPATGVELWSAPAPAGVNDLDMTADGMKVIITGETKRDEQRLAWTTIAVRALSNGRELCSVTVPNCTSELIVGEGGNRLFLAPTQCGRDPVSVIDLDGEDCSFRGNLPGFGPVALSPDGETVVAFMDRDAMDPEAPPLPEEVKTSADRYHLMFIDVDSLDYETAPLGAALPRYTFTPNGRSLIVDKDTDDPNDMVEAIVLLDVAARTVRMVAGPMITLDQYALTPDAEHAFVVDEGLFDLDLKAATVTAIGLTFRPVSLNMTPDGTKLLLKSSIDSKVYVYEVDGGRLSGEITSVN